MTDGPPATQTTPQETSHEPARTDAEESWLKQAEELPERPRRRILTPLPVALLLALALACGFVAGALVQKGQGEASAAGTSGLRGAAGLGGASAPRATASAGASGPLSGLGTRSGAGAGGAGAVTAGEVAYLSGHTLYVRTAEGNTVKITPAPGSKVTKTVETHVGGIHPGETVAVSGARRANGSISADAIRVGGAGGFGGGSLLGPATGAGATGASGGKGGGGTANEGSGGAAGGGPALFGKE